MIFNPVQRSSNDKLNMSSIKESVLARAITMHSNKKFPAQQETRLFFLKRKVKKLNSKIMGLKRHMIKQSVRLNVKISQFSQNPFTTWRNSGEGKCKKYSTRRETPSKSLTAMEKLRTKDLISSIKPILVQEIENSSSIVKSWVGNLSFKAIKAYNLCTAIIVKLHIVLTKQAQN